MDLRKRYQRPRAKGCHRLMHELTDILNERDIRQMEVVERAGVCKGALDQWRHRGRDPRLGSLDAVLNVLGYRLTITPINTPLQHRRPESGGGVET